jgi:hypothetical protein
MVGTTNRNVMTVAQAKAQLVAGEEPTHACVPIRPMVQIGAALLAGIALGHRLRKQRFGPASSCGTTLLGQIAAALAPLLLDQVTRSFTSAAAHGNDNRPTT